MNTFRSLVLHRAWIPAVVVVTVAVFVLRADEASSRMSRVSRAVGVQGWTTAGVNEFGETRLRWMKAHAALHEPVRARVLMVPMFVDQPGIETAPVTIRVRVAGVDVRHIVLQRRGWQTATFDLYEIFGEPDWRSLRAVTLAFEFTQISGDGTLPMVGLGDVHWTGPGPQVGNSRRP